MIVKTPPRNTTTIFISMPRPAVSTMMGMSAARVGADLPQQEEADDAGGAQHRSLVAAVPPHQRMAPPAHASVDDAEGRRLRHRAVASSLSCTFSYPLHSAS